jgi:hypothetical protein
MQMTTHRLAIQTIVERDWEYPDLMTFTVRCSDDTGEVAGSLEGFLLDLGYYPEPEEMLDDVLFLDGRSAHALEAFEVLAEHKSEIEAMLSSADISAFIHLEEAKVQPRYRGEKLALRLMREARFMLHGYARVVTLKAHPLEGEATPVEQARLAAYYQSDPHLDLKAIDATNRPGWLVASWDEPRQHRPDGRTWATGA